MSNIQLVALDMDGTLLSDFTVPEKNIFAIQSCLSKGVRVCIATGRVVASARSFLPPELPALPIVAANGSCVVEENDSIIAEYFIAPKAAAQVIQAWAELHGGINGMTLPDSLYLSPDAATAEKLALLYQSAWPAGCGLQDVIVNNDILDKKPMPYYKIVVINRHAPEILVPLREQLTQISSLFVTTSWPGNLEIMPAGVNKGSGLAALCRHYNIERENVMAVGDNEND
ncbi:MAG: HAD family hydrolase, partial [Clostridia bacterium]|nr:HAD family hydrolase [Clostridia bacterium]